MTPGFNDGIFDEAAGWIPHGTDPAHLQRYRIRDGRIYCETILAIHAGADRIMDRLMGRWTWWRKGLAMDFQRHGDGSTEQVLAPVWWYWARIRIRAYAPVPSPERGGLRIPMSLSGTWVGPSTFDIFPDAGRPAWSLLRGRFHGVENHVPLFGDDIAARAHLGAESGTLFPPFPKGTGLPGLVRDLEMENPGERESSGAWVWGRLAG